MPIAFDQDRWIRVLDDTRRWWAGELDLPLILSIKSKRLQMTGAKLKLMNPTVGNQLSGKDTRDRP